MTTSIAEQPDQDATDRIQRIVFVTGASGAGRSSALNVLEDCGFAAIDNLPLRLLPALVDGCTGERPMALGIDARTQDFSPDAVFDALGQLSTHRRLSTELLFLDCATDVLLRRFSETRRRHPMGDGGAPLTGIEREQALLAPLRQRADVLIDTSSLNIHQLRSEVEHWFAPGGQRPLGVSIQSFSYKRGLPRSVDMVFDCRFLRNPHWEPSLRASDGTDSGVSAYVSQDPRFASFLDQVEQMCHLLLPAFREEGKSNITIAFGCTGGRHRSVTLAEQLALRLAQEGWQVSKRHRELDPQNE